MPRKRSPPNLSSKSVILSDPEEALATEVESKNPDDASSTMPMQGVLPKLPPTRRAVPNRSAAKRLEPSTLSIAQVRDLPRCCNLNDCVLSGIYLNENKSGT